MQPPIARPINRKSFVLFCSSASIFIYELLIVRVFSILFKYNVVFIMISVAIMGLGLGGFFFYRFLRGSGENDLVPPWVLLGFPWSIPLALWLICRYFDYLDLAGAVIAGSIPFFLGGSVLASIYANRPEQSGRLYFFDLAGGISGCLISLVLVQILGVINAILLSALPAAGAIYFSSGQKRARIGVAVILMVFFGNLATGYLKIGPDELKRTDTPIGWITRHMGRRMQWLGSSWNLFSRCDLFSETEKEKDQRRPIFINGGTEAMMIPGRSYEETFKRFRHDITFLPYLFGKNDKTLILGSGGGRDVRLALMAGARQVTAVEIDQGVIDMTETNRGYTGDVYNQPGVTLKVEDGRTFIMRDRNRYDRLVLSLSSTFGYSDVSGIGQMENYLYTQEAFGEYFQHLSPGGTLTIFINFKELLGKFILSALIHMRDRMGITPRQGMTKMVVIGDPESKYNGYGYALMIKKGAYDFDTLERIVLEAEEAGLAVMSFPHGEAYDDFQQIADGKLSPEDLIEKSEINLSLSTDNRPFFMEVILNYRYNLIYLALALVIVLALFVFLYLHSMAGELSVEGWTKALTDTALKDYLPLFVLLGCGFMLVEIALTKRFSFYLAYPQLNLAVVLVSLLAGCGLGSLTSGRLIKKPARGILLVSLLLVLMILTSAYLITPFIRLTVGYSLPARCFLLAGFLFPTAFLLGIPFPLALRSLGEELSKEVAWFWGINGISSVIGAVMCMVIAMSWGFQAVFYSAAGCYFLVMILGYRISLHQTRQCESE